MTDGALTEESLQSLREQLAPELGARMTHTLGVEKEAVYLGGIYLPEKIPALRCAALLHDLTKRFSFPEQLQICREYDILLEKRQLAAPKIIHAITAAAVAPARFPAYCDDEIVSGIRWHTTGHADMTVFEAIIYLADYTEETRTFADCRALRAFFREQYRESLTQAEKTALLARTMVRSFDLTMTALIAGGQVIDADTVAARSDYLEYLANAE